MAIRASGFPLWVRGRNGRPHVGKTVDRRIAMVASALSKASLSPLRQQLLLLMQRLNFGRIEGLVIKDGDPVLDPLPRVIRELKFGGDNLPRPEARVDDFL